MSEPIPCPDCGQLNPAGSTHCVRCNFPLAETPAAAAPPAPEPEERPVETVISIPMPPRRPRRPPPTNQALSLWLLFGVIAAATVIYIAIKANVDRASAPVEGASPDQSKRADELRAAIAKDSTDVAAHVGLGNVLYDTANWSEAIIHYRAALRRDSSNVHALVDLGVCYYNLGDTDAAEESFHLALARDPHQPIALFNLGIVHERRKDFEQAMQYFHKALQSAPPEEMKAAIMEAMQRVQESTGNTPPPLNQGR